MYAGREHALRHPQASNAHMSLLQDWGLHAWHEVQQQTTWEGPLQPTRSE